jgi:hypothetical protein
LDWNRLAMMRAFQRTEGLDTNFEPRAVAVIESQEPNEGAEGGTRSRNGPIRNEVKFRTGGAIALGGNVMAYVFNTVGQKFTLF